MKQLILSFIFILPITSSLFASDTTLVIPDKGWRLWLDRLAPWEQDSIYLPDEIVTANLPVNSPTGGWEILNDSGGIQVTLPSSVEEHFWGITGFRPYKEEYFYEAQDSAVKNGNYLGVSWWWQEIDIPKNIAAGKAILSIRGARLRTEVYWNRQLVGYNTITEVAFTCDVTNAIRLGEKNQLAIRTTNPGGRMDWLDTQLMTWGFTNQRFHKSHGFGGLDRGITLTFHDPVYCSDLWILNMPQQTSVTANGILVNTTSSEMKGTLTLTIINPEKNNRASMTIRHDVAIPANAETSFKIPVIPSSAELWNPESPKLYVARAELESGPFKDTREVKFGFRWFTAEGIGNDAVLRLNGRRIRLTSAISWGFWGKNGLFPSHELAEREIRAAKAFGMNCIQFHRNVGKTEVLDLQDQLGLCRYMEPGGGQTALGEKYSLYATSPADRIDPSGRGGEPSTFAEKYMEEKIIRMIRDHRSHPSLLLWCVQNEMHPDLHNPRIFYLLKRMHREDPSRIIVLKSGFPSGTPSVNQAWMMPYDTTIYFDNGKGYSGWWDDHTVGGPGVWRDEMYKGPDDFTHRSENMQEIVMWGEMLGAAVPDNHEKMVAELKRTKSTSYDLADHEAVLDSYNKFIDRWEFRKAFPSAGELFEEIGNKSYDFWGRVIETARLAEANDYHVISGWESTSIENHSGLLDNLRNFKGDASLIGKRLSPLRPVIKFHSLVVEKNSRATFDLYLINETETAHAQSVNVFCKLPSGQKVEVGVFRVPPHEKDRFVYPIMMNIKTGPTLEEGAYTFIVENNGDLRAAAEEQIWVVDTKGKGVLPKKIGIISRHPSLSGDFELFPGISIEKYAKNKKYDAVIVASRIIRPQESQVESTRVIQGTDDQVMYRSIHYGSREHFDYLFSNLPPGETKVTLKFAELFQNAPNVRIFDVAINGKIVLPGFDVFTAAGGKDIAFDTTFTEKIADGILHITIPRVYAGSARICGMKITAGDTVIAINCGGKAYKDRNGLEWKPYLPQIEFDRDLLQRVRNGMPLVVLAEGGVAAGQCAELLAKEGAFKYYGNVQEALASWMGSWYFVRKHELYSGLPVNCSMGSFYQIPVTNADGVLIDGDNVQVVAGYSRDHSRSIGAGSFTAELGKGTIVFHTIPGVVSGLNGNSIGMHGLFVKRLVANSLRYTMR